MPEGEEEPEPTEEEQEEGPEALGSLEADNALGGVPPDTENAVQSWTGLVSSTQEVVKYQVRAGQWGWRFIT